MSAFRVMVKRSRLIGGGYGTEWATWVCTSPDGMSGVMAFHPTHTAALAHALAEVGLTEKENR
ncbi:MAG: hypothetical protein L0G94_10200 [Brachybacterium sp.]|uniref:hypothetical protein n=1 Tax=Brachybacterium sp. TaxID=1891286 RepID=UPI0026493381|nr:hypothetical protein [Brachybacterium sp.]MDN5687025.1 hypothetical protein [Brachybacterium sp.]